MICVPAVAIYQKAERMPASYLEDCKRAARLRTADQCWCFSPVDFYRIRQKYGGQSNNQNATERLIRGVCQDETKHVPL
jgi:hypothetical protein